MRLIISWFSWCDKPKQHGTFSTYSVNKNNRFQKIKRDYFRSLGWLLHLCKWPQVAGKSPCINVFLLEITCEGLSEWVPIKFPLPCMACNAQLLNLYDVKVIFLSWYWLNDQKIRIYMFLLSQTSSVILRHYKNLL